MKFLVTGSSGFIGAHLISKLLESGHEVVGIDVETHYYSPQYKVERREALLRTYTEYRNIKTDIAIDDNFLEILDQFQPDTVIHLAAQPGVRIAKGDFDGYTHSNLIGFSKVLSSVIKTETPNFLFASSSSVYGNSPQSTLSEDSGDLHPISFYGATKLSNEILGKSVVEDSNVRIRGLRFFTVYGSWGRPDMAYFRIARSLNLDTSFNLYGDTSVLRDFTHVSDTVQQIQQLALQLAENKGNFFDVVNIGGGAPRSLQEMIHILEKMSGKKLATNVLPKVVGDVKITNSSPVYRESLIGKHEFVSLEKGLEDFYSWISSNEIKDILDKTKI